MRGEIERESATRRLKSHHNTAVDHPSASSNVNVTRSLAILSLFLNDLGQEKNKNKKYKIVYFFMRLQMSY